MNRVNSDMSWAGRCGVCGEVGQSPCVRCITALEPAADVACPAGLDSCVSAFLFRGTGRELVVSLKYHNQRQSLGWLAGALAGRVASTGVTIDVATWVPTSSARRRQRGFDQSERLARRVGRRLHVPVRHLVRSTERAGVGAGQTGKSAADRQGRPAFRSPGRTRRSVLLIDDVLTTGATMNAAAIALRQAGVAEVHGATLAFTPPPQDRPKTRGSDQT